MNSSELEVTINFHSYLLKLLKDRSLLSATVV